VGLAGSSAIVIGILRALAGGLGLELSGDELARRALQAEVDRLGIAAGPQDREVQAHEGVLAMDFSSPEGRWSLRRIDVERLPTLFLAWDIAPGESSGVAHEYLRARFRRGDPRVVEAMREFAKLADAGLEVLLAGDHAALAGLLRESLVLRRSVFELSASDLAKIEIARREDVPVKLPGSGGAIVGIAQDAQHAARLEDMYRAAGFGFLLPHPTVVSGSTTAG
jgi:glucuronokinase